MKRQFSGSKSAAQAIITFALVIGAVQAANANCDDNVLGQKAAKIVVDTLVAVNRPGSYIDPEHSRETAYVASLYTKDPSQVTLLVSVIMKASRGSTYELGQFSANRVNCTVEIVGFSAAMDKNGLPWIK